ncbi:putative omega-hydroxypalmitate O-feruloyl transferase-like [Capsicum annuum]|nr:putative omega-hydroxypalmitate O-feruloyl transferase-like [Capsicum annuum]
MWRRGEEFGCGSRIDRILHCGEWGEISPQVKQSILPKLISDHNPLLLTCGNWEWMKSYFKFETWWLGVDGFKGKVKEWWSYFTVDGRPGHMLAEKLKFLETKLKKWSKDNRGYWRQRKEDILAQISSWEGIQEHRPLTDDDEVLQKVNLGMEYEEGFDSMMRTAIQKRWIKGFQIRNLMGAELEIYHLLYTDDTIIFCGPAIDQIRYIRLILLLLKLPRVVRVNWGKSSLFQVKEVPQIQELSNILGCGIEHLPTKYLGMSLGYQYKTLEIWGGIIKKTKEKLAKWKAHAGVLKVGTWDISFRRLLNDWEIEQVALLLGKIDQVFISNAETEFYGSITRMGTHQIFLVAGQGGARARRAGGNLFHHVYGGQYGWKGMVDVLKIDPNINVKVAAALNHPQFVNSVEISTSPATVVCSVRHCHWQSLPSDCRHTNDDDSARISMYIKILLCLFETGVRLLGQVQVDIIETPTPTFDSEQAKLKAQELRERARKRREEEEKKLEKKREKERIHAGKELLAAKRMTQENETRCFEAQRKTEKEEERRATERICQKLQQDMAERRAKLGSSLNSFTSSKSVKTSEQETKNPLVVESAALSGNLATKKEVLMECLRSLRRQHKEEDAKVQRAFKTLLVYVRNIVSNPDEGKFRKIRLSNPAFQVNTF